MTDIMLVADIGGTNARFALAKISDGKVLIERPQLFRAEDFKNLRDAVDAYFDTVSIAPKRACFAAAGPLIDGIVDFTNSHWTLRTEDIAGPLKLDDFRIVNDFYALAAGVAHLPIDAFLSVKEGEGIESAPKLVIGPGTGLGQAIIVPTASGDQIIATEGGHVAFAPHTDEELEVWKFIAREHSRVSVERLLSGRGLVNIHRALTSIKGAAFKSLQANEISDAVKSGSDPIAVKAVDMFCAVLGRVAGDAVMATGARGGVILGGGILPKIRDIFLASDFTLRFSDKGRMSPFVDATPVKLIVSDGAALYGAAVSLGAKN